MNNKILFLTTSYPSSVNYNNGIFVHNLVKTLINEFSLEIRVIKLIPHKFLFKYNKFKNVKKREFIDGVKISNIRYFRIPSKFGHSISTKLLPYINSYKFEKIINDFKPDIIHSNWATPSGYTGIKLGNKYNIPTVCSIRGSDIHTYPYFDFYTKKLTIEVLKKSDKVISVSDDLINKAKEIYNFSNEKATTVYTGCELNRFKFNDSDKFFLNKKFNIKSDQKKILFVGGLKKTKGVWELLKTFRNIVEVLPNLSLIFVGNGKEKNKLQNFCVSNNINNSVYFAGQIDHNEIHKYYNSSDIFVLPSYNEGLPNAIVEAMACSKPVIATKVGGIPEIIDDDLNGLIIENENIEENLYKKIIYLLENEDKAINMGLNARKKIKKKFNWKLSAENIKNFYDELLL